MNTEPIVYIVDDNQSVLDSLRMLVESASMRVQTFSSAEAFLEQYDPERPGCLVLDVRMEGMSGLELLDELNLRDLEVPVIIITAFADVPTALRAMESGAVKLLEKPCDNEVLLNEIRRAIQLDQQQRTDRGAVRDTHQKLETLSEQEQRIMDLLISGAMNKTIASKLGVSLRTVERDRARLFAKMGVDSVAPLVEKVAAHRAWEENRRKRSRS